MDVTLKSKLNNVLLCCIILDLYSSVALNELTDLKFDEKKKGQRWIIFTEINNFYQSLMYGKGAGVSLSCNHPCTVLL